MDKSGAKSRIDGISRMTGWTARIPYSCPAITAAVQVQFSGGRDIAVEQGFRQDTNISLRLGYLSEIRRGVSL